MTKGPRGLTHQRVHTGPYLISPQTLKAYLQSRLILPFSHHAQLHTYDPPLLLLLLLLTVFQKTPISHL